MDSTRDGDPKPSPASPPRVLCDPKSPQFPDQPSDFPKSAQSGSLNGVDIDPSLPELIKWGESPIQNRQPRIANRDMIANAPTS
jgi:hypothetical protein